MSNNNNDDEIYELKKTNLHDKYPERPQVLETSSIHSATPTTITSIEAQAYLRPPRRHEKYCGILTLIGIFGAISLVITFTAILWIYDDAFHIPGPSANVTGAILKPRQFMSFRLPVTLSKFHQEEQIGVVTTVLVSQQVGVPITTVVIGSQEVSAAPMTISKGDVVTSTAVATEYTIITVTATPSTTTVAKNRSPKRIGLTTGSIGLALWVEFLCFWLLA